MSVRYKVGDVVKTSDAQIRGSCRAAGGDPDNMVVRSVDSEDDPIFTWELPEEPWGYSRASSGYETVRTCPPLRPGRKFRVLGIIREGDTEADIDAYLEKHGDVGRKYTVVERRIVKTVRVTRTTTVVATLETV